MNFFLAGRLARCFRFLRASCAFMLIAAAWLVAGANSAHAQSRAFIHSISPAEVQEGQTVTINVRFDGTPRTDDSLVTIQFAGDAAAPTPEIDGMQGSQYHVRYGGGAMQEGAGARLLVDSQRRGVFRVPANDDSVTVQLNIRDDLAQETTQTIAFALVSHTDTNRDASGREVESFRQSVEIAENKGKSEVYIDAGNTASSITEDGVDSHGLTDNLEFDLRLRGEERTTNSIVVVRLEGTAAVGADYSPDFTWRNGATIGVGTVTTDTRGAMARVTIPGPFESTATNFVRVTFLFPQDNIAESEKTLTYRIDSHTDLDGGTDGTAEYDHTFEARTHNATVRASEANTFARFLNPPRSVVQGASTTLVVEFSGTPAPGTNTFVSLQFAPDVGFSPFDDITIGYDSDTVREGLPLTVFGDGAPQLDFFSNGTSRANIILTAAADGDNDYERVEIRIVNYGILSGVVSQINDGHLAANAPVSLTIVPEHFSTTESHVTIDGVIITPGTVEMERTITVREGLYFLIQLRATGVIRPNASIIRWEMGGDASDDDYFINQVYNSEGHDVTEDSVILAADTHYLPVGVTVRSDHDAESTETFTITLSEHTDLSGNSAGRSVSTETWTFIIPPDSGILHFPQDDTRIAFGVGARRLYAVLSAPARIREYDQGVPGFSDVSDSDTDTLLAAGCTPHPGIANPSPFPPVQQFGTCGGFRIGVGSAFAGSFIPIESVHLESIGGGGPSAVSTGVVVIELERPVRTGEETLWLGYNGGTIVHSYNGNRHPNDDQNDRRGVVFQRAADSPQLGGGGCCSAPGSGGTALATQMLYDEFKDSDGDGVPDAAEAARFGTDPRINTADGPQVSLVRGAGGDTVFIASGRLTDSDERLSHLGVVVTGASTVRAYYLSDTFGYAGGYVNVSESYGCTGRFPANYDAPLITGGCALVDFENILPNVAHTIGWFAANNEGWATANTASGLPQQVIQRIPRVNMAPARNFVRREATDIFVRAVAEAPVPTPADNLSILLPDGSATTLEVDAERRSYASTLTRTPGNQAVEHYRIDPAETRAYDSGDPGNTGFPDATSYEIGPVNEMAVYFLEGVAPSLGRPALTKDSESEERTLVEEGGTNYKVTIPVLFAGGVEADSEQLANIRDVGLADEAGERVITARFDVPADFVETTGASVSLTVIASAIAQGDYATTQTATITLSWPVVPTQANGDSLMAAALMGDNDGDSIPNEQDPYPEIAGLPVMVSSGTEGMMINPQDHIRPVLPVHELSAGDRTKVRASSETVADEGDLDDMGYMDDYEKYSASEADVRLPASVDDTPFEVTYDFDISGVAPSVDTSTTAQATTATVTGGRAGVIIPLPQMLSATTSLLLYKYRGAESTQTEAFTVDDEPGGNEFGFAPPDENGVCPTDDGSAASPYRDTDGNLDAAKAVGDLCVVLYIVDGGPNDEDGEMNGIIKDPIGTSQAVRRDAVVGAAQGGGGGGGGGGVGGAISGGGGGSFGLAGLGVLLLLALLAMLTTQARRTPRASRAHQRAHQ